jgi:hypothetical protein
MSGFWNSWADCPGIPGRDSDLQMKSKRTGAGPIPAGGHPLDMVPGPDLPKQQSEADPQTLTGLYEYIQAENKALKLQLASLQCLVNDILTEIKKPTPTAPT